MKFRKKVLQAIAIASSIVLPSSFALAQTGPYYVAPKLMYSHQIMDNFTGNYFQPNVSGVLPEATAAGESAFSNASRVEATYKSGKKNTDNAFGGGVSLGYDFGAMGYSPVRTELEFLARGSASGGFGGSKFGPSSLYYATSRETAPGSGEFDWNGPTTVDYYSILSNFHVKSKVYTLMANAFYDFPTNTAVTPYVGGGLGMAYIDTTTSGNLSLYHDASQTTLDSTYYKGTHNNTNFAWHLGGGVSFNIRDNMALDLGYRYSDFGKAEGGMREAWYYQANSPNIPVNISNEFDMTAHEVTLGLRISAF